MNNKASFGKRFLASFIDGILLSLVDFLLRRFLGVNNPIYTVLSLALYIGYPVYFIGTTGQTLGKQIMHIKVVSVGGGKVDFVHAFLREIIGKLISTITLFIGYLWMLWDPQKQTLHDKIANTFVVNA